MLTYLFILYYETFERCRNLVFSTIPWIPDQARNDRKGNFSKVLRYVYHNAIVSSSPSRPSRRFLLLKVIDAFRQRWVGIIKPGIKRVRVKVCQVVLCQAFQGIG
jgi:hypothetical protein